VGELAAFRASCGDSSEPGDISVAGL